jgi:hypothetical protein
MERNTTYTIISNIEESLYQEAELRAKNQKVFANSHRKKEANEVGCLGEVLAEQWMRTHGIVFKVELEHTTHDYKVFFGNETITIDVKTKDRTVIPKIDYDNSAPCYNHEHQKPDYFLFVTLHRDKKPKDKSIRKFYKAYIVGGISYKELDEVGIRFLKNEKDWRNGTKFWTDCLNVEMWQLIPNSELINIFKGELSQPTKKAKLNIDIINEMKRRIANGEFQYRKLPCT